VTAMAPASERVTSLCQIAPTPRQRRLWAPASVTASLVAGGDRRSQFAAKTGRKGMTLASAADRRWRRFRGACSCQASGSLR
jgi:hypothetical protein